MGNLNARRDLTYVSDTVDGFQKVGEALDVEGKTFNLGIGSDIRIGDLAEEVIDIIGKPVEIVVDKQRLRPEKSEVQRLLSDNNLAKEQLGWEPKVSLRQGLEQTIAWISKNLERYQPGEYQR
jgi:dTDP-glucose 4,6-dehydratase